LNKYDAIICDEVHTAAAASLTGIMEKATDVSYRIGMTGSLSASKVNGLVIQGLFGKIEKVASTRQLIDEGYLSEIEIKCLVLKYNNASRHLLKTADYQTEIDFIISHERRNKFIRNLALSLKGNTLILFTRVEDHGEVLYKMISERGPDRVVHFIHGGVEAEDRDAVRDVMENSKNCITIASFGTMSTGTNVKRINNIILASPTKSVVRVLQSIGRGLRKSSEKDGLTVYDISDQINKSKSKSNHTYKHFIERLHIFVKEGFNYTITELDIEKI
jgi:superfamily II DNA or RNA helicase